MTWLVSFFVGVLSGVVSLFLAGFISNIFVSWFHISSREGASGYFVIFNALLGGFLGFFLGIISSRVVATYWEPGFGKELLGALAVVLVIAGLALLIGRLMADIPPEIGGRTLDLEVEYRFPNTGNTSSPPTAEGNWEFTFRSVSSGSQRSYYDGKLDSESARLEDGRWIVPAKVYLYTERGKRTISLIHDDKDAGGGFLVPLPSHPGIEYEQWSDWLPRQQQDGSAWPLERMSYRFRVQRHPLPPPPKTQEEYEAEEAAAKQAEFDAIAIDSPIQAWFPYIAYDQPQTAQAIEIIAGRETLVQEIATLAVNEDPQLAAAALRCIDRLSEPPAELIEPVKAAGRDIAARMKAFNEKTVEQDPSYEGAADASIRFNGWMTAVRKLRSTHQGDFIGELKTILELSRVREDSIVMGSDIRRVASYYLKEWAGIAPLPTDPLPR